jgi:hypothetical protein
LSTRGSSDKIVPYVSQQTGGVPGYAMSQAECLAGVTGKDSDVTLAEPTSLSRGEGYEGREHGEIQKLFGEHFLVYLFRV